MPIPTNTATPLEIARKLRTDADGVTFTDPYNVVNRAFQSIISQTANVLEFMNNCETAADADLLMEFAYDTAHLFWRLEDGENSPALHCIDTWLDTWFHGGHNTD